MNSLFFKGISLSLSCLLILQLAGCETTTQLNIHNRDASPSDAAVVVGRIKISNPPETEELITIGEEMNIVIGKNNDNDFRAIHQVKLSALGLSLDEKEGFFYWYLSPGEYVIKTLKWRAHSQRYLVFDRFYRKDMRVGASFSVPKGSKAVYIGNMVISTISKDQHIRDLEIKDEIEIAKKAYAKKFGDSETILIKSLLSWPPPR